MNKPCHDSAFENFKNQLDNLSQSLQRFDSNERDKALEILHECIQGLNDTDETGQSEGMKDITMERLSKKDECSEESNSVQENPKSQDLNTSNKMISEQNLDCLRSENEEIINNVKTKFTCPKCGEEVESKQDFLEHLRLHSGKSKCCSDCRKDFPNTVSYKQHKELDLCRPSKTGKMNKCKLCNKKFSKLNNFKKHVNAHKQNQCAVCGDNFPRRKQLIIHAKHVHQLDLTEKTIFRCDVCKKTFNQRRSLVHHYSLSHRDAGFMCRVCLHKFNSQEQLDEHSASAHKQLTFSCDTCQSQFSRHQQYLLHLKTHNKYSCSGCDDSFSNKKAAMSHSEATSHRVDGLEPSIMCEQCGQLFLFQSQLEKHMAQHAEKVPKIPENYCEKCKMSFKRAKNLRDHLQTKAHLREEEPKNLLPCEQCNKTFTNKNNLRVHIARMHKGNKSDHSCIYCDYKTSRLENFKRHVSLHTEKPQFVCDKCGLQVQSKNSLQEHELKQHSEKKNFSCDKCGKVFSRSSDLNRHLTIHLDTVSFSCHHCGSTYKSYSNLNKHIALSHNVDPTKKPRLKKLFLEEVDSPPSKVSKKPKCKVEQKTKKLKAPQIQTSTSEAESNTLVVMTDCHPEQLLEVNYNLDFASDKSQVYNRNLDLQVVESMIELDSSTSKQGQNVLINVRNIFERSMDNQYILQSPLESSMIENMTETLNEASQHIAMTAEKPDDIPVLQDYMISSDLNFLNV